MLSQASRAMHRVISDSFGDISLRMRKNEYYSTSGLKFDITTCSVISVYRKTANCQIMEILRLIDFNHFLTAHVQNRHISTSGLKSNITDVFTDLISHKGADIRVF